MTVGRASQSAALRLIANHFFLFACKNIGVDRSTLCVLSSADREVSMDLPIIRTSRRWKTSLNISAWEQLERLAWRDALLVLAVLILARLLIVGMQWQLRRLAEGMGPRQRLTILRFVPICPAPDQGRCCRGHCANFGRADISQHSRFRRKFHPGAGLLTQGLRKQFRGRTGNGDGKRLPPRRLD